MSSVQLHSDTRKDMLKVEWTALTTEQRGGANILSYKLVWDGGLGGSVDLELTSVTTYYTELSYTITDGIQAGEEYLFKVQALNIYGWGDFSDISILKASEVPSQPVIAVTAADGLNVVVTF